MPWASINGSRGLEFDSNPEVARRSRHWLTLFSDLSGCGMVHCAVKVVATNQHREAGRSATASGSSRFLIWSHLDALVKRRQKVGSADRCLPIGLDQADPLFAIRRIHELGHGIVIEKDGEPPSLEAYRLADSDSNLRPIDCNAPLPPTGIGLVVSPAALLGPAMAKRIRRIQVFKPDNAGRRRDSVAGGGGRCARRLRRCGALLGQAQQPVATDPDVAAQAQARNLARVDGGNDFGWPDSQPFSHLSHRHPLPAPALHLEYLAELFHIGLLKSNETGP